MDTKLKNRRKLGLFLAAVTIFGAAFFMIYNYHTIYRKAVSEAQKTYTTSLSDREYLESFLEFSYVLYNQEISSKTGEAKMSQEEISDAAEVWIMKRYIHIWITGLRMDQGQSWDEAQRILERVWQMTVSKNMHLVWY